MMGQIKHRRLSSRLLIAVLVILLVTLQYKLWFEAGSIAGIVNLNHALDEQKAQNAQLQERNNVLDADVTDLKSGNQAIAERARNGMGMVKKDETFYQIVPEPKPSGKDSG